MRGYVLYATAGMAAAPALAAVVSQRAVAETYVVVFAGFALLLLVVVLSLVAVASKPERRASRVRRASAAFVALAVGAGCVLGAMREAGRYSSLEGAFLWCAGILILAGFTLVAHALVESRRRGG
jgi:hypothetical protein